MQKLKAPLTQVEQQVAMLVTFKVKPEMSDVFRQALMDDLIHARQESGYISMNLFVVKDDPNTLFLLERWQNQAALDNHFTQPYTQAVLKLTETALTSPLKIFNLQDLVVGENEYR